MPRKGLLVDFGGVLTTDPFASFCAFCELEGLDQDAIRRSFREDRDCREMLIAFETGKLDESHFEHGFAAALGVVEAHIELTPGDCVFVDDLPHNLTPAAELGMATVHHRDAAQTVAELERLLGVPMR